MESEAHRNPGTHDAMEMEHGAVFKGDVQIIGHIPSGGHLWANGNGSAVIRESHIPLLSVSGPVQGGSCCHL
jgi:hypothetical protein